MKRYLSCHTCSFEGFVDEPFSTCPKCDSASIVRCVVVECCGEDLFCPGFTNTCKKCETDYNWAGQTLAPRNQWGDETGETIEEILDIDNCTTDELLDGPVALRLVEDLE